MRRMMASLALATTLMTAVPAVSQPGTWNNRGWNSNEFWRGAPSGVWERIQYLQQRIDRGVRDGTLTRREADRAQYQLNRIRRDAAYQRRNGLTSGESRSLQVRLDNVSRNIRWARTNSNTRDWSRYRTDYDARRYYRDGSYQERRLGYNDEVYRGSDGRYYCKRSDGTTGLIVGAAAGGLLGGPVLDGGIAGTLIGGTLGALLGREVDRSDDIRCR